MPSSLSWKRDGEAAASSGLSLTSLTLSVAAVWRLSKLGSSSSDVELTQREEYSALQTGIPPSRAAENESCCVNRNESLSDNSKSYACNTHTNTDL